MRRGLSTAGLILLAILLTAGLAGCQQEAPARPTDPPQAAVTQQPGVPPSTSVATPRPGETVVSVFTPAVQTPGTVVQPEPTQTTGGQPVATTAPAPTAAPGATATPGTAAPPPGTSNLTHVVQAGETLSSIAARYGTTVAAIVQANMISDPNSIQVGQTLKIPVGGSTSGGTTTGCRVRHTVKAGDWVWQIARDYGVSPYDILAANGLTIQTANTIYPGQVLCIP